jgi:hypothetical protein
MAKKVKKVKKALLSAADFMNAMDWEGGFQEFVKYGIDPQEYDLPPELRIELAAVVDAHEELNTRIESVVSAIEALANADEGDE